MSLAIVVFIFRKWLWWNPLNLIDSYELLPLGGGEKKFSDRPLEGVGDSPIEHLILLVGYSRYTVYIAFNFDFWSTYFIVTLAFHTRVNKKEV
jgi:hypothetical protein